MITLTGKSVFGGVSIGKIAFYKRNEQQIKRWHVDDTESEVKRFEDAKAKAVAELQELYQKAMSDVGETNAMIFEIHQMMLEDLDYIESIINIITAQQVNAEYAVGTTADNFAAMFSAMDDAYMQGRAADVKDVSERILNICPEQKKLHLRQMNLSLLRQMILFQVRQSSLIKKKYWALLRCMVLRTHIQQFWQEQ